MRNILQHYLNEMHIYCRLRVILGNTAARRVAHVLGIVLNPLIYGGA